MMEPWRATTCGCGPWRVATRRSASRTTGSTADDDLFARPDVRGTGVGRALIERLAEMAREHGCAKVRWMTAEDNHVAQLLYDSLAQRTTWVTYDQPV